MSSIIGIGLSPNTESDDVTLALRELVQPWNWKHGKGIRELTEYFLQRYKESEVFFYNSGRSALSELIKAFGIGKGDEIIVQAFTCIAVPNSVIWNGAHPVFADIDSSYNLDPSGIEKHISSKTKAIIVQHTFGIPAQMNEIVAIVKKHKLILIEDCAHALGATYKDKEVGLFGDAAIFSFGRDKVISSVFGGAAIIKETYKKESEYLHTSLQSIQVPSLFWIFRQLFHPVIFFIILPLYKSGIGKVLLVLCQKVGLLSIPVYPEEKKTMQPADFPMQYPPVLARLAYHQLQKLHKYNANRKRIAEIYYNSLSQLPQITLPPNIHGAIYLRFPIQITNAKALIQHAKQNGILLGNWYHNTIDPQGINFELVQYKKGSNPKAEFSAEHIVNLPTRIHDETANSVISLIQQTIETSFAGYK